MRPVYICTQVFNRHELLRKLVQSVESSNRRPDGIYIVDHGYDEEKVKEALVGATTIPVQIITLEDPGCAHNGNWFLKNVPNDRLGCGDDVEFLPDTIGIMTDTEGDCVIADPTVHPLNPAACAIYRDSLVQKIGYLDEQISPRYLYFEDTDWFRRMDLAGVKQTVAVGAHVRHVGNATLDRLTPAQMEEHHYRFRIASANYSWKWGGPPFNETLTEPRPWPRPEGWGL